ncbi:MAG TPA: transcriptional regulator [Alphaproteobacteria bacterium]|nr:transcriptional regulator [Alphaproteobacteria bacterium]HAJ47162.1 transcriptional regulator [Alphaproteobacteria bacterium]
MRNPVDLHVGKQIRQRRWLLGLTQQQLAQAVGIRFQQVQKYESGANRVSASRLWEIANALGVQVTFFYEGLDIPGQEDDAAQDRNSSVASALADKDANDLLRAYAGLAEGPRRRLLDLVRAMQEMVPPNAQHSTQ